MTTATTTTTTTMTKYHPRQHHHYSRGFLLVLLLLIIHCIGSSPAVVVDAAAHRSSASASASDAVKCRAGWTGSSGNEDQHQILIPETWMNDGYCDCPFGDGNDEPNTNACSGSQAWPGIASHTTIG